MPCNCGSRGSSARVTYVATFPDGTTQSYADEISARMAVSKRGGSYKAVAQR